MEWDAVLASPDFAKVQVGPDLWRNEWGIVRKYTGEEAPFPVEGPIHSFADLERYVPPDPRAPGRYRSLLAFSPRGPRGLTLRVAQPVIALKPWQALLRSRYEHYSPFLNVGYLDTATGDI